MKTIETLIEEIKEQKQNSKNLQRSIHQQEVMLMNKIRIRLEKEGVKLEQSRDERRITILVEGKSFHNLPEIFISEGLINTNFPPISGNPYPLEQIAIFKVLGGLSDEITNLHLDSMNLWSIKEYQTRDVLVNLVAEDLFNRMISGEEITHNNITYTLSEGSKGRYAFTKFNNKENELSERLPHINWNISETKNYYKSDVISKLYPVAREMTNTLVK